ncbi:nuclear protein DGCR14 [Spinellus fusiger]|nr:nuclear protein DGCR14 [Spinellus fusiger]
MATHPVVLDEDTYTEAISHIIERDFFPNLGKLKAHQNYFAAQDKGSLVELQQAEKALRDLTRTPKEQTDTPSQNFYHQDAPTLTDKVNLNLSLDQFQTLYTSEDNASFTDLLEKANIKRNEKYMRIFNQTANRLRIKADPNQSSSPNLITGEDTKYIQRNALMYFAEGTKGTVLNEAESRAAPRAIAYSNTQLEQEVTNEPLAPSDIAAEQGSTTPWKQLNGVDEAHSPSGFRGYSLVDATPTLAPSSLGTPLMTWGSIEGTPILIKGSETPGPQFSLPKASQREQLGMRLSERASRAYRKKTKERLASVRGTPRSGSGLMSHAAQHLIHKSATPYSLGGFDAALRSSYGSPSHTPSRRLGTPTPLFKAGATPGIPFAKSPFNNTPTHKR